MTEVTSQNISYKLHFRVPDCLENFTAHGNCESFEFYVTVTWSVMTMDYFIANRFHIVSKVDSL